MARILLSYLNHSASRGGGAVHGNQVVWQLRRFGHQLVTTERQTDDRLEQRPRTPLDLSRLVAAVDLIYMRCDDRPYNLALLAANRGRRPLLVELNAPAEEPLAFGSGAIPHLKVAWRRFSYGQALRAADGVVCVSEAMADYARRYHRVAPDRVFVVPNGGIPAPELPEPGPADRFRVVWAGEARWPWQAIDRVIDAARMLREAVPHAEVVVYTRTEPGRFDGCSGIVHHRPIPHTEMAAALAGADASLCLYRPFPASPVGLYNSPLKLFDYMAAGLPVVGSRLGQIAEVLEHGTSGLLVGDDPNEVAAELIALARDPALRQRLGRAAHARLAEHYTWDHAGERTQAVVERLLGGRPVASRDSSGPATP